MHIGNTHVPNKHIYTHIYRQFSVFTASVGLAQARPNYNCKSHGRPLSALSTKRIMVQHYLQRHRSWFFVAFFFQDEYQYSPAFLLSAKLGSVGIREVGIREVGIREVSISS